MTEAIGIMEGAFFVSRSDILAWINDLLKLNYTKIEQTATGAVACQVLDVIFPGVVPMHKVNWKATQEYEFINNYKIVQQVFIKQKISKVVEVEKLVKAKYQDNLEFMQWLKRFYDLHANVSQPYDALAKRKDAPQPKKEKPAKMSVPPVPKKNPKKVDASEEEKKPAKEVAEKVEDTEKYKIAVEGLRKERDFYFGKLRDLEILLHFHEKDQFPFIEMVRKILYATEDDKIAIDSNGNLVFNNETGGNEGEDKLTE